MPSLAFVNSCIGSPSNTKTSDYIYFNFLLKTPSFNFLFEVYKDLKGSNSYYNYMLSKYPNKVYTINRLSNNDYYNAVLNAFGVPEDKEIRCFTYNYDYYYFCFDDFPSTCKGSFSYKSDTVSVSPVFPFIDRFFNGQSYQSNESDFFKHDFYTTRYGSAPTCKKFTSYSNTYRADNKSFVSLPLSLGYVITNNEDPANEFLYSRGYGDYAVFHNIIYYLSLTPYSNSECCLAQCFGITE